MSTTRSLISLNASQYSFTGLAGFAQVIHDGFVAEVADYATPKPTMPVFQGDIDALNTAITAWGVKGNRGSHSDYVTLVAAQQVVINDLRMLADYAQNTQPDFFFSWLVVGFFFFGFFFLFVF